MKLICDLLGPQGLVWTLDIPKELEGKAQIKFGVKAYGATCIKIGQPDIKGISYDDDDDVTMNNI